MNERMRQRRRFPTPLTAEMLAEAVEIIGKVASYSMPNIDTMEAQEGGRWIRRARQWLVKHKALNAEEQTDGR